MARPEARLQTEENKALYFRFATILRAGSRDDLGDIVDPMLIDHCRFYKALVSPSRVTMERRVVIQDVIAEGDRVAGRVVIEWRTGAEAEAGKSEFIEIVRVSDGRIIEHWCQPVRQALVQP